MISQSSDEQQALIIRVITRARDEGIGIRAIEEALAHQGLTMPRRTLQRRLDGLLAARRIWVSGGSRSTVYRPLVPMGSLRVAEAEPPSYAWNDARPAKRETGPAEAPVVQTGAPADAETYVPVSPEGLQLRDTLRMPIAQRPPARYELAFLEAYRPNVDAYLSPVQRERLHALGRTPFDARPAGTYARDILGRLLIDLSWASSRLEGNTYSLLDTERLLALGRSAEGCSTRDTQMILNHKAAIEMLVDNADDVAMDRFTILNLHALLADNLLADAHAGGRLRTRAVGIGGSVYSPLSVPQRIDEAFALLLEKAQHIADPIEQAFFAMVHLPYLQPFEDVNKRVSRLAANLPLIRHNLCPLSFVDVPVRAYVEGTLAVYEQRRIELLRDVFLWAYERSCQRYLAVRQEIGEPDAFRLRYRALLTEVVQGIVRAGLRGDGPEIEALARDRVAAHERGSFVHMARSEIEHLHEGNIARYQLRRSEFAAWPFKRTA